MSKKLLLSLLLLALLFSQACFAVEIENSTRVQSMKARVVLDGTGRISGSLNGHAAEIELLSFKETDTQKILSLSETLEINGKNIPAEAETDEWGNRYALFKVSETGQFTYRIEAVVETNVALPALSDFSLQNEISEEAEFIEPSENIESNHESIRTLALNKFSSDSLLETVAGVTEWVYSNVEYDLSYYPETYSALTTLETRKGVCDEYAVLAASFLRAKGIPTRIATGLTYNPEQGRGWNNHAWLQAYHPANGWISLDPTFGEAGVVDGTHIVRGFFPDPSESSVSKASVVQTASLQIGPADLAVEPLSAENFAGFFKISANDIVMPAKQWHELKVKAKSSLGSHAIGWFSLVVPTDFSSEEKTKMLVFGPGEEKDISWEIRVDRGLESNEYLTGTYKVIALDQEVEKNLKVMPAGVGQEEAMLIVTDLIPTVSENRLVIEITIENRGGKAATAEIEAAGFKDSISLGGFQATVSTVEIANPKDQDYIVSVKGDGLDYEATVTLHEGIPFTKKQETSSLPSATPGGSIFGEDIAKNLFSIELVLILGLFVGVAVIVFLLKALFSN